MVNAHTESAAPTVVETDIPARLDRLRWGRFHTLVVVALGITWILDGLEVTLAGAVSGALKQSPQLHFSNADVGFAASAYLAGAVTGAVFFGWLTDRLGRKRLFFITLAVYLTATAATALFLLYAALNGVVFSILLQVYAGALIATAFVITAGMFAVTSLYGFVTKRDLTSLGAYLFMGLIGIIIASLVNIFLKSTGLDWAISIIGVVVFAGLTAYDTQSIKEMYSPMDDGTVGGRKAVMGALRLYLDFINLFLMLLRLMGDRR